MGNDNMIETVNQVSVSKEELLEIVDQLEHERPDEDAFYKALAVVADLHPGDHKKVSAIMFRMEALSQLLVSEGSTGWTLPVSDGRVLTEEPVFAAAANEPLIVNGKRVEFERTSFFRRVLEESDPDTIG